MNIPESVLRSSLIVGDKRVSQSSDVGKLAYSVLADTYLRELDEMPITEAELVKDGWSNISESRVWERGNDVLHQQVLTMHGKKVSDHWELIGVPEFELQTMGELRTVLRLRGESA